MENQTKNDVKSPTNAQEQKTSVAEQTEKKEAVEATQFDPKEAKHGVDFCCGSCGG